MTTTTLSHAEMTPFVDRWAYGIGYAVGLHEACHPEVEESPDGLYFTTFAASLLTETKVSRSDAFSDFLHDNKNRWGTKPKQAGQKKRYPKRYGIGQHRYIVCPEGMLEPHEVDDDWGFGLAWLRRQTEQFEVVKPTVLHRRRDFQAEMVFLIQALRNAERAGGVSAQEARKSQEGRIPPKYHEIIRDALRLDGPMRAIEIVKGPLRHFRERETKRSKHAEWLARDAHAGLIDGVVAEGRPTVLRLTEIDDE